MTWPPAWSTSAENSAASRLLPIPASPAMTATRDGPVRHSLHSSPNRRRSRTRPTKPAGSTSNSSTAGSRLLRSRDCSRAGDLSELAAIRRLELAQQCCDVRLDGPLGDEQTRRDLGVREPFSQRREHVRLTSGQLRAGSASRVGGISVLSTDA